MRVPKPFYREQTKSYYVQLNGKQTPLGPDEKVAWAKYHEIMAGRQEPSPTMPAAVLIDTFLEWCKANHAPRTYQFYLEHLQSFTNYIGKSIKVMDVKPHQVTQWLATRKGGDTHKYNAVNSVKRSFRWGVDEGYITVSPVARCKPPRPQPREVYIEPEQWQDVLKMVKAGPLRDAMVFLWLTGCRSFELRRIEAKHIEGKCIVFPTKNSKGKRKRRVIQLVKEAYEIVTRLAEKHPTGPIFRNRKMSKPWTHSALGHALHKLADKHKIPLFAYAIRHSFCTRMLLKGMDPVKLAEVMGHSDLKMIMSVYSHLQLKRDHLRDELERFTLSDATTAKPSDAA